LQGESARARDDDGEKCESDLDAHKNSGFIILRQGSLLWPSEVGQDEILENEIEYADDDHQTTANYTIRVSYSVL
jgi:hypothetical protein